MSASERLKEARIAAGIRSAAEAARQFGWTQPTYAAHENGTRGIKPEEAEKYAAAFRVDACWMLFGKEPTQAKMADVSEKVLREILKLVMAQEGAKNAAPEEFADLVIELCHYVSTSGEAGLDRIVDFELARRARKAVQS